jgi:(2Fe-2S) ferredoxin
MDSGAAAQPTLLFVGGAERSHQNPRRRTQCPADEDFVASRAELFAELEKPRLTELPDQAYAFARWKRCRVGPDYHIKIDGHWYSAPYRLIRELVDARIDDRTVEIFRYSTTAAGSPDRQPRPRPIGGATPPSPTTCPAPIGDTANGRPPA